MHLKDILWRLQTTPKAEFVAMPRTLSRRIHRRFAVLLGNVPEMRLSVSYNLFDGEELLEDSIRSFRNQIDHISVVYQKKSHWGQPHHNSNLECFLANLQEQGLIDEIIEFEPEAFSLARPKDNVTFHAYDVEKRNIGLEAARRANCTHYMSMDSDEIYQPSQFQYMKDVMSIKGSGATVGVCRHLQYYVSEIYVKAVPEQEYVSTLIRISPETKFIYGYNAPVPIDPARKPNYNFGYVIFLRSEVEMQHMSFVRRNLRAKLSNHGAKVDLAPSAEQVLETYNNWNFPDSARWSGGVPVKIRRIKPRVSLTHYTESRLDNSESK